MQSQKHPSGMFDKYLQDDSSSGHYERYGDDQEADLTDEAEPMPADDEAAPMHAKHMEMVCEMMHMMQEMLGMFSKMLAPAPKADKEPADEYEDE